MPRPPKNKAIEAGPSSAVVAPRVIDVESFVRVRDSVISRLASIQELIKSFSADYLRQTNLLLGEGTNLVDPAVADFNGISDALSANPFPPLFAVAPPVEEKKERKKRTHDPNAPKRPLTPYFLYMQTARPIIASDLGEDAPKGAVQEEGQRRWAVMAPDEKQGWNTAYQYNLRLYNARVHSYKQGNVTARDMNDDDAQKYADAHNIPMPTAAAVDEPLANEQAAIAEQLQQSATIDPEPVTQTPKKGKESAARGKRKTATPAAAEPEPAKAAAATPASPAATKRKRASKAAPEAEEPKKSGRKKAKTG